MTNEHMLDLVMQTEGAISVSMSKDGIFLHLGDGSHEINSQQAEILWEILPQVARLRTLDARAHKATEQPHD